MMNNLWRVIFYITLHKHQIKINFSIYHIRNRKNFLYKGEQYDSNTGFYYLRARYEEGEYYLVNVKDVIDCIDYEKLEYTTIPTGEIFWFDKYAFKEETIKDKNIFKSTEEPLGKAFVSEEFKRLVIENNLTGFDLKLVWDSEENK